MARTQVSVTNLTLNSGVITTATALSGGTGANGHQLINVGRDRDLRIIVTNSGSATGPFTVKAGDYLAAGKGDITEVVGGGITKSFSVDGAQVRLGFTGAINIDAGITGTMYAIQ